MQLTTSVPYTSSIRVRGRFEPVLEGMEPTPAIEHRCGQQHRMAEAGRVAHRSLAPAQPRVAGWAGEKVQGLSKSLKSRRAARPGR